MELLAPLGKSATLVLYENALCEKAVAHIRIVENSQCGERIGVGCSCFSIDGHSFCVRSNGERQLWLRAISNVKVKLRHKAPDPTEEDMAHYRSAVREKIAALREQEQEFHPQDPLLPRTPRVPIRTADGDGEPLAFDEPAHELPLDAALDPIAKAAIVRTDDTAPPVAMDGGKPVDKPAVENSFQEAAPRPPFVRYYFGTVQIDVEGKKAATTTARCDDVDNGESASTSTHDTANRNSSGDCQT